MKVQTLDYGQQTGYVAHTYPPQAGQPRLYDIVRADTKRPMLIARGLTDREFTFLKDED